MHRTSSRFRKCLEKLPPATKKTAKKNFTLLKADPLHPSLHFKKVGRLWSVRIGLKHRALAVEDEKGFTWVWIGTHTEYDQILGL